MSKIGSWFLKVIFGSVFYSLVIAFLYWFFVVILLQLDNAGFVDIWKTAYIVLVIAELILDPLIAIYKALN